MTTADETVRSGAAASTPVPGATWIGVAILSLLVIVGFATGSTPRLTEGRVLVVGDSLTNGANKEVRAALADAGWDPVVDGRGGWTIGRWREPLVELANFARPDVAVVALGTNNCDRTCRRLGPEIDAIVKTLLDAGVQEILWVNVQESSPYPADPAYVNDEIERAAVRWRQVRIVDLDTVVAGHPEWHLDDGIHFNEAGSQQFAALIVAELAS